MCKTCNFISDVFNSAKLDSHFNYFPVLMLLGEMEKQERISLVAGDCLIEEVSEILFAEKHYTICHYFQCNSCKSYIFIGACIRGTPIYEIRKLSDNEMTVHFDRLWGKIGLYFKK